jgi:hypothetical protein
MRRLVKTFGRLWRRLSSWSPRHRPAPPPKKEKHRMQFEDLLQTLYEKGVPVRTHGKRVVADWPAEMRPLDPQLEGAFYTCYHDKLWWHVYTVENRTMLCDIFLPWLASLAPDEEGRAQVQAHQERRDQARAMLDVGVLEETHAALQDLAASWGLPRTGPPPREHVQGPAPILGPWHHEGPGRASDQGFGAGRALGGGDRRRVGDDVP